MAPGPEPSYFVTPLRISTARLPLAAAPLTRRVMVWCLSSVPLPVTRCCTDSQAAPMEDSRTPE